MPEIEIDVARQEPEPIHPAISTAMRLLVKAAREQWGDQADVVCVFIAPAGDGKGSLVRIGASCPKSVVGIPLQIAAGLYRNA